MLHGSNPGFLEEAPGSCGKLPGLWPHLSAPWEGEEEEEEDVSRGGAGPALCY